MTYLNEKDLKFLRMSEIKLTSLIKVSREHLNDDSSKTRNKLSIRRLQTRKKFITKRQKTEDQMM